jgi:16S rRNA processing protein RimM
MDVVTDFPERLKPETLIYVGPQHLALRLHSSRQYNQDLLVAFEGYDTPEATEPLRNQWAYVRADDRPALEEGEYYHHQLLGLKVVDEEGKLLGILSEILATGANDVYVVSPEFAPEILLPAIDPVIQEIDLETGTMRVHLLPGLLPE